MKGYIHSTLGQLGKAQKPGLMVGDPTDGTREEDNDFP
jgi:hypothetical protein